MLKFTGSLKISGCKSLSHRSVIIAAMAVGQTKIYNLLESQDILSTINILRSLGIKIKKASNYWVVNGNGTGGFNEPDKVLDCGNSGSSARMLLGAVASNPINCTFIGDKSLSKRTMSRVTNHLEKMGAEIKLTKNDFLPVMIRGSDNLLPTEHIITKASAQIKSALIFAALNIKGKTIITELTPTRDHTERMLKYLKVKFKSEKSKNGKTTIELDGPYEILPKKISIASDPSSAAFFIVGALITPYSKITLENICLNPSRIAYIDVLKQMGAKIKIKKTHQVCGEDIGRITSEYSQLRGITINSKLSPFLIDEYPILSIAASQATGVTIMKGLSELRHKESDRIKSITYNLIKLNFNVKTRGDDIIIENKNNNILKKAVIKTFGDHRIAMSFSILAMLYTDKIKIDDDKCISISYPNFKKDLNKLITKYNA